MLYLVRATIRFPMLLQACAREQSAQRSTSSSTGRAKHWEPTRNLTVTHFEPTPSFVIATPRISIAPTTFPTLPVEASPRCQG